MSKLAPVTLFFLASSPATIRGGLERSATSSRRLDYENVGLGYTPRSQVTDHAAIDLDQASIEKAVDVGSNESFENAKAIYLQGGHSKSFASINLSTPLTANVGKGTKITGINANGNRVNGYAYTDFGVGRNKIQVQYQTLDIQDQYVDCQVGALNLVGEENTSGCFAPSGQITIEGVGEYSYLYSVLEDNLNGRTISGFSTLARSKMFDGCPGCPYPDYKKFYDYYGVFDYANEWVIAALDGRRTSFMNGNADFGKYTFTGRAEAVKKGTAYMNIFMYVIREFYDAIDDCQLGCMNCNDDPVHAWDEGVVFYTGSTESNLLYTLGNKQCKQYSTCGPEGIDTEGIAKINYDSMTEFSSGQFNLMSGNCNAVRKSANRIAQLMYVPLIQGVLQYAYEVEHLEGQETEKAEGAAFAATVLPVLNDCSPEAAQTVYDNMGVGAMNTSYMAVKSAFEDNYHCMGTSCQAVAGLYNLHMGKYYELAYACADSEVSSSSSQTESFDMSVIGIAVPLATIALLAIFWGCYKMKYETDNTTPITWA